MPNRLLKEGITDSEKINALAAEEEVFFYRLLVVADDFGLMDARPAILRARCFPLKEPLPSAKVEGWLKALNTAGLIARYEVDGQPYLMIGNWDQRQRSTGKYPRPSDDDMLSVVSQLAVKCPTNDRLGLGSGKGSGKGAGKGSGAPRAEAVAPRIPPGEWTGITPEKREVWVKAYPAVDLDVELAKAMAWVIANPNNVRSNWERFLTNWFSRAQDRAPARGRSKDDERAATIAGLTGRRPEGRAERDITADSAVVG